MGSLGSSAGYRLDGQELCMDKPQGETSCQGQSKPGCWGPEVRNPRHITFFGDTYLWDVGCPVCLSPEWRHPHPQIKPWIQETWKAPVLINRLEFTAGPDSGLGNSLMLPLNIEPFSFFQGTRLLAPTSFLEGYPSNCPQNS